MEEKTAVASEVNRLYWDTEESVADIANQLGVSRRALYEQVEPLATGADCASCGAPLHYANRSARAAGIGRCLACGSEREISSEVSAEDVGTIPPYGTGWPAPAQDGDNRQLRERAVKIASFALLGVAVGAIATLLLRREH